MEESIPKFIKFLKAEKNYSDFTIVAYELDLCQFREYINREYNRSLALDEITKQQIRGFMSHLVAAGLSRNSIGRKLAALRSYFRYLNRIGEISANPAQQIQTPKYKKKLPVFLSIQQALQVLNLPDSDTPEGLRDRAILELFYGTGIRLRELTNLDIEDIDFYSGLIRILGKGRKERMVPLGPNAAKILKKYL